MKTRLRSCQQRFLTGKQAVLERIIKMSWKNYYQSGIKCHKKLRSSGDNSGHKYSIKMANVPHSLPVRRGVGCSISQFFDEVCNTAEPHRKLLEQQYHFKKSRMGDEAITVLKKEATEASFCGKRVYFGTYAIRTYSGTFRVFRLLL